MKTKSIILLALILGTLFSAYPPQVIAPTLILPDYGDIAQSSGEWGPWDRKDQVVQKWIALADSHGGSYESIGKSSSNYDDRHSSGYQGNSNWDIVLFKFGNPNGGRVMIDAHLHGNEYYGHEVLYNFMYWVLTSNDPYATRIMQNNYLLIVPCANYRFGRTNFGVPTYFTMDSTDPNGGIQGINLNRNFSPSWSSSLSTADNSNAECSGEYGDSEPESQALINAWNQYHPRIYWNLHQGAGPYTLCTAVSSQAQQDANEAKNILSTIQDSLGISTNRWSFSVSSGYGSGYAKDGAAYRGSAGFLTEVSPGWSNAGDIHSRLSEGGDLYNNAKALFIAMCQAVEVESSPQETWSITVSSSQGGTTNMAGTQTLNVGQSITVTAYYNSGYRFDFWILDGNVYSSSSTVTIPSQSSGSTHTIYAQFSEIPQETWSITISSSEGGSTSMVGTRTLNVGQSITVTGYSNSGYMFDSWILDGNVYSSSSTVTIPSQSSGSTHTIYAQFSEAVIVTRKLSNTGSISYPQSTADISVNVNTQQQTDVNTLSMGFQLDGRDISAFARTSTLQDLAEEANFKMVRFFHHRYGWAVTNWDNQAKTGNWDWSNYDRVVNAITGIGAKPLICLGYGGSGEMSIPTGMDRWSQDPFFPDPEQFAAYAREWVRHFSGEVKYWEILNEPYQHYYWTDQTKLARYCTFWNIVATEMKKEDPTILISHDGSTVKMALDYWVNNGEDLDFLGFHKYDSSTSNPATDAELFARAESERVTDYGGSDSNWRNYGVQEAKAEWNSARGETLPVICGEANINWAFNPTDDRIQTMTAAVWAALTIRYQSLAGLDYWLWWDFYGSGDNGETQFSMISPSYDPWYSYYVMKMIGTNLGVGDIIVESTSSSDDIRTLSWNHNGKLNVLLICKVNQDRTVSVNGLSGTYNYFKVDSSQVAMQNGNINLTTQNINMEGYSVILLQAT